MKKFEKSEIQILFSVKGGALIGSRTNTKSGTTVDTMNDAEPTEANESPSVTSIYSPAES